MGNRRRGLDKKIIVIVGVSIVIVLLALIAMVLWQFVGHDDEHKNDPAGKEEQVEEGDLQGILALEMPEDAGAIVKISEIISKNENDKITFGIDVARYQGTIDWAKVAADGVEFAMIRVGYRTTDTGEITADSNAKYNMQEAQKNGIQIGAYFFSTSITKEEAIEEAQWTADYISKYKITYPVAYNCEGFKETDSRQYGMTKEERTDMAWAFLSEIREQGYEPMFYASKGELENDTDWETSRIDAFYKIWVAQYPMAPYPETNASTYSGVHAMWQYTSQGTVSGIEKPVDINIAYFGYNETQDVQDEEAPEHAEADVEALMNFQEVNEKVTAKDRTNLRDKPSQGSDSTVKYTLKNGETATRTGISNSGWSRVIFDGKTYYAVSSYLTTDLSYKTPMQEPDDGIETDFKSISEKVTAKEAVNLRTLPSVTNSESKVVVKIVNGDVVTRTGINIELGWSRVEYNGQTLYCVSSYLMPAE